MTGTPHFGLYMPFPEPEQVAFLISSLLPSDSQDLFRPTRGRWKGGRKILIPDKSWKKEKVGLLELRVVREEVVRKREGDMNVCMERPFQRKGRVEKKKVFWIKLCI